MTEVVNEPEVTEQVPVTEEVTEVKPQPGEKTDSALLLKSLQEEREKRRIAEAETERLRNLPREQEIAFSDEGKSILGVVESVKTELKKTQEELAMERLLNANPALKDKVSSFEEYRSMPENFGMSLQTAAKAFLIENDLVEAPKPRKGLESASGGGRTPVKTGMSPQEIDDLRVNNYNEYARRIRAGTLNT